MKTLIAISLCLTGCMGAQPFVRADNEGYEAGVQGKWKDVVKAVVPAKKK